MNWGKRKAALAKIIITCEIIIAVICFPKRSIFDISQDSNYAAGSEFPRVLNSPRF